MGGLADEEDCDRRTQFTIRITEMKNLAEHARDASDYADQMLSFLFDGSDARTKSEFFTTKHDTTCTYSKLVEQPCLDRPYINKEKKYTTHSISCPRYEPCKMQNKLVHRDLICIIKPVTENDCSCTCDRSRCLLAGFTGARWSLKPECNRGGDEQCGCNCHQASNSRRVCKYTEVMDPWGKEMHEVLGHRNALYSLASKYERVAFPLPWARYWVVGTAGIFHAPFPYTHIFRCKMGHYIEQWRLVKAVHVGYNIEGVRCSDKQDFAFTGPPEYLGRGTKSRLDTQVLDDNGGTRGIRIPSKNNDMTGAARFLGVSLKIGGRQFSSHPAVQNHDHLECASGERITGFRAQIGHAMDAIAIECGAPHW